jgi:hypothetical protein
VYEVREANLGVFLVSEILLVFLNLVNDEEAEREEQQLTEEEKLKRRQIVTKKIQSVSRLLRLFNILRTEREMIMKIKGLSPNSKLPPGLLLKGPAAISEGSYYHIRLNHLQLVNFLQSLRSPWKLPEG